MVGAEPRVPASDTKPDQEEREDDPDEPATVACQKLTPKPRM